MKNIIILLLLLLTSVNLQAQKKDNKQVNINGKFEGDKKQIKIANKFIKFITKGDINNSWELFDKKNNPQLSKEVFEKYVKQLSKDLKDFDKYELILTGKELQIIPGKKNQKGKMLNMYTFKAISTKKKIITNILIDVIFLENGKKVYGLRPKQKVNNTHASTSSVPEIEVEKSFSADINNKKYNIVGVNIVPFSKKTGLLVIQVDYKVQKGKIDDAKIRKEAIKFAKYLINNGYLEKGKLIAKKHNLTLRKELGVSFFNTKTGHGYNVMLKPDEFK